MSSTPKKRAPAPKKEAKEAKAPKPPKADA